MKEQTGFEKELESVCAIDKSALSENDLQDIRQQQLREEAQKDATLTVVSRLIRVDGQPIGKNYQEKLHRITTFGMS